MDMNPDLKTMTILFRTVQAVEAIIKKDISKYGYTINEFSVIETLFHKGRMPVQGMCQKVLIPNSSMTYVLDKLEERSLIKRSQDHLDKRIYYVELTDSGLDHAKDILPKHYEVMRSVFDILSVEEKAIINDLLKKIGYHALNVGDMQ